MIANENCNMCKTAIAWLILNRENVDKIYTPRFYDDLLINENERKKFDQFMIRTFVGGNSLGWTKPLAVEGSVNKRAKRDTVLKVGPSCSKTSDNDDKVITVDD